MMKTLKTIARSLALIAPCVLLTTACHYHPSTHGFCPTTQTEGWTQDGPWEEQVSGDSKHMIYTRISSPYDPLPQYGYPDNGKLGYNVTRISFRAFDTKTDGRISRDIITYDLWQAVLEVDGKQYAPIRHAWTGETTPAQYHEVTSPLSLDYGSTFDFAFPVEINARSKIQLRLGTASFNGEPVALPAIDYHYCPQPGEFTNLILH